MKHKNIRKTNETNEAEIERSLLSFVLYGMVKCSIHHKYYKILI